MLREAGTGMPLDREWVARKRQRRDRPQMGLAGHHAPGRPGRHQQLAGIDFFAVEHLGDDVVAQRHQGGIEKVLDDESTEHPAAEMSAAEFDAVRRCRGVVDRQIEMKSEAPASILGQDDRTRYGGQAAVTRRQRSFPAAGFGRHVGAENAGILRRRLDELHDEALIARRAGMDGARHCRDRKVRRAIRLLLRDELLQLVRLHRRDDAEPGDAGIALGQGERRNEIAPIRPRDVIVHGKKAGGAAHDVAVDRRLLANALGGGLSQLPEAQILYLLRLLVLDAGHNDGDDRARNEDGTRHAQI